MRLHRCASLIIAVVVMTFPALCLAFDVPANDGFYTQTTPLLAPAQEAEIERLLEEINRSTSNEIAILVVETLRGEAIDDVANAVFRDWGVGKSGRNNGILLLVASADREMRMEVGYGLEGAVPDIVAKGIIEHDIAPQFREARYFDGLSAGIDALRKHVAGEYTAERYVQEEGGSLVPFLLFLFFVLMNFGASWLGRTKSWWVGGVLGGVLGIVLAILFSWWLSIPMLVLLGLLFDYIVSKHPPTSRRGRGGLWGGGLGGGRGGGGGFGGFGGGSSGGGGASGRW